MRLRDHAIPMVLTGALVLGVALPRARADERNRAVQPQVSLPAMDHLGIFGVESGRLVSPLQWGFKLTLHTANEPMVLPMQDAPNGGSVPVLKQSLTAELGAYLGLTRWLQLNLELSLVRQWLGDAFDVNQETGFAANDPLSNTERWQPTAVAGDVRLGLKWGLLSYRGLGLAILTTLIVPTGDETVMAGERSWAGEGRLALSYDHRIFRVAANVGYLLRDQSQVLEPVAWAQSHTKRILLEVDDELTWGVGALFRITSFMYLGVEIDGRVPLFADGPADLPLEVLGGLRFRVLRDTTITLGGGAGIGRYLEHDGILPLGRSPLWSVFAAVTFSPTKTAKGRANKDTDGDGIFDDKDQCPTQPEDGDGFEDGDGCPDPDNDQDGIPDTKDKCPDKAEDRDGFQDDDGCPELDNDRDTIPDSRDRCPNEAEDVDGFKDDDGCPDLDNDGDGIPDKEDKCPNDAEDFNKIEDTDGCPEGGRLKKFKGGKIDLKGRRVSFRGRTIKLTAGGKKTLDQVAIQIRNYPSIRLIRIEAHTDSYGRSRTNLWLSQRRAVVVRNYLIARGVSAYKLTTTGYGESRPIMSNRTKKGRIANRRVEFIVVYQ